jgi:putative phosphoribosyl transferase
LALRAYRDREEAGRILADALRPHAEPGTVVLGAPRGGVVVAAEVARALRAPLDVVLVRKLPIPFARETAFGVVAEDGHAILDRGLVAQLRLDPETVESIRREVWAELRARARRYRAVRPPEPLEGRTAVLVDDGLATGYTMLGAVRWVRSRGARRVVLAAPVASDTAEALLRPEVDLLVCPIVDPEFLGVSAYYGNFDPVEDETVVELLERFGRPAPPAADTD